MSSMEMDSKASTAKPQGSKAKKGKQAKKDASNKPKATEKQPVKAQKPVKATPAKERKEKVQKKPHGAASSGGKKKSGKPKTANKQPGKVKTVPAKDQRRKAQKRSRGSEGEITLPEQKDRQIILGGCPSNTTRKEVREVFPAAERVFLVKRFKEFTGTCFVTFATSKQADAAYERKNVTIAGQAVTIRKPGEKKATWQEEGDREIILGGCPSTTTEEDVKKAFPAAKRVFLVKKYGVFHGTCFVTFATSDEADAAHQQESVTIAGQAVHISKKEEKEAAWKDEEARQIVLEGCPSTTTENDVKEAFPAAERVFPVIKFGQCTGTCFVTFATSNEANAAHQQKGVTIAGQAVTIRKAGEKQAVRKRDETLQVVLHGCPSTTTEEDVKNVFPAAESVFLVRKYGRPTGTCFVTFATSNKANAARQQTDVTIAGQTVTISKLSEIDSVHGDEYKREIVLVNCPFDMLEEDVRKAFPTAQRVRLVGHRTGKCCVMFATRDEAEKASQQKKVTIKGRKVHGRLCGQTASGKSLEELRGLEVVIKNCPYEMKKEDVKEIFPTAQKVHVLKRRGTQPIGTCVVQFSTHEEAVDASAKTGLTIKERPVRLFLRDDDSRPAKRQKVSA